RKKRNQTHQRTYLEVVAIAVGQVQNVVIETVVIVPEFDASGTAVVHSVRNVDKVFEELAGDVVISGIFAGQLQCDGQHGQGVHGHAARAVRLVEKSSRRQRSRSIEHANVV